MVDNGFWIVRNNPATGAESSSLDWGPSFLPPSPELRDASCELRGSERSTAFCSMDSA